MSRTRLVNANIQKRASWFWTTITAAVIVVVATSHIRPPPLLILFASTSQLMQIQLHYSSTIRNSYLSYFFLLWLLCLETQNFCSKKFQNLKNSSQTQRENGRGNRKFDDAYGCTPDTAKYYVEMAMVTVNVVEMLFSYFSFMTNSTRRQLIFVFDMGGAVPPAPTKTQAVWTSRWC